MFFAGTLQRRVCMPRQGNLHFSKALLEHNQSVTLIILGDLDDKFKALARRFPKLTLAKLTLEKNVERFEALVSLYSTGLGLF